METLLSLYHKKITFDLNLLFVNRLSKEFFASHDTLTVAEKLIGKTLVHVYEDGRIFRSPITETEAYIGPDDLASHGSRGMTPRTKIMFGPAGYVYVYLIYGMYWMLNFVTGNEGDAQAVLIRGVEECSGPGRLGRLLELDKSFYGEDLGSSKRIWLEDTGLKLPMITTPRIGIESSGEPWVSKPWRFLAVDKK